MLKMCAGQFGTVITVTINIWRVQYEIRGWRNDLHWASFIKKYFKHVQLQTKVTWTSLHKISKLKN